MPSAEMFYKVDCPECGATRTVYLPVERPADAVLGTPGRGIVICLACEAQVPLWVSRRALEALGWLSVACPITPPNWSPSTGVFIG